MLLKKYLYLEKLIYTLNSKRESGRFPSDEEFRMALSQKNVYLMRGENKKYLFERLENGGLKDGGIGVWNKLDSGVLSVEHIMPQTLTRGWIEDLGEDHERIFEQWLHRLAKAVQPYL
ncbi:MAG: HNH endonuclease family protein [Ruminococcus flavefaciens]|nr:HNH endonuclease family protein [Ruminococcus flavefaciens]